MVACFILPMAGSNAGVVFDVGLNQASAGANFERGAVTAEIFGRNEDKGNDGDRCDRGDHRNWDNGDKGDKDDHGDRGKHCCNGDHRDWDNGDKGDHGDHDKNCEKSPSKPHH